jgi:hypothetical protein
MRIKHFMSMRLSGQALTTLQELKRFSLLTPIKLKCHRLEGSQAHRVPSLDDTFQRQEYFLDIWGQQPQVHNLSHPGSRYVPECGDFGIIVDVAFADKIFVVDGQSHVAGDARQAAF